MIDFRRAKFLLSAVDERSFLRDRNIIVMIGRSNAGKSTLVNVLCDNKKLMKVSKEPGRTRQMNYLDIDDKYYLVDAPGYGYAGSMDYMSMLASYFDFAKKRIKCVYFLLDPLRKLKNDDFDLFEMCEKYEIDLKIIFAKMDKFNATLRRQAEEIRTRAFKTREVFYVSSKTKEGIEELRKDMIKMLENR